MEAERFAILEHTSEVGVVGYGPTPGAALAQAGLALTSILTDLERVEEREERRFVVEGRDPVDLLVAWLGELIYVFEVERLVFRRFVVDVSPDWRASAVGYGERLSRRHPRRLHIKAVTYHQAALEPDDGRWRAQAYLDV
jgi:SHS2 domain-containing protein